MTWIGSLDICITCNCHTTDYIAATVPWVADDYITLYRVDGAAIQWLLCRAYIVGPTV